MGDRADAVALEIAERKLIKMGYRWGPEKLALFAAEILAHLEDKKRQMQPQATQKTRSDMQEEQDSN